MLTIVADNRTNQSHALTCYGIDFDADGNITALYTSDSDDGTFQLSRHALRNTTRITDKPLIGSGTKARTHPNGISISSITSTRPTS